MSRYLQLSGSRNRKFQATNSKFRSSGGIRGKLIIKGHSKIRGYSITVYTTTDLVSHNNSNLPFLFIRHDERRGFQLLHGGFTILFIKYHNYIISSLNDLSASNDVSMIFQEYIEEKTQNFLFPKFHP